MSAADLASRMRHGFPKESVSDSAYRTELEYVGLASDLRSAAPQTYGTWGSFYGIVIDSRLDPLEGTDWAILTVILELKFDGTEFTFGEKLESETTIEIDWVDVQRNYFEHPQFKVGGTGTYALTEDDVEAIRKWELMTFMEYKRSYIYALDDDWTYLSKGSLGTDTLTANAQKFAKGIEKGLEYWVDKAPVCRKTETYVGGPPPISTAGQKENPIGIPNQPTGYEWIRSADRSLRRGSAGRWERTIEWLGADKVEADSTQIYW